MSRGETLLQVAIVLFAGILIYHIVPNTGSALGAANDNINGTSQQSDNPLLPTSAASSTPTDSIPALLSLTNILLALKVVIAVTATSLSYLIYLPKLISTPLKHSISVLFYIATTLMRPLQPILAPVLLSIKIIMMPVIVPILLVYKFVVFVYPLYVFLGAAAICGASGGILARKLGSAIIEDILGFRKGSQSASVVKKEVEASPERTRRLRVKAS